MEKINWGIIGCGNVTEIKSGPAFGKVEGSQVTAVMRRDAARAKDYAERHQIPAWYSRADDLIHDPGVNAVYVATPPSSHAAYAIQAMEAGKVVYVEKPMAADYASCLEMNRVSKQTGIPLYVAYYRRFLPYFQKVKEIIEEGWLGDIRFVHAELYLPPRPEDHNVTGLPWRVLKDIAGGGYFYDLACHQIDLFDWFFGPVKQVTGNCYNRGGLYESEDTVFAELEYASGLPLAGSWCFVTGNQLSHDVVKVYGSMGRLEFSTFGFSPIILVTEGTESTFLPPNPENIQYWFIRNMVEELRGLRPAGSNGETAAKTNQIMDKILGKK
jgi:predicted dehydrogenase